MLIVKWSKHLEWEVNIWGSKNAVLPIIASSLLIEGQIKLTNVPDIKDVHTFLDILEWIWVKYKFKNNSLSLDCSDLKHSDFDLDKIKKIRVSILLLAPLLHRLWKISIPTPGWCNLGKRPIESHLKWLENIWYKCKVKDETIKLSWKTEWWDRVINAWFWVTVTENLIVANVLRKWKTTIMMSALEPHVVDLVDFLNKAWAKIELKYDHRIEITWVKELSKKISYKVCSDYIQSGTYAIIWALASKKYIDIKNARIWDLYSFIQKLHEAWVKTEDLWNDTLRVYRAKKLNSLSIQTNIFPWFPTDLQSPFAILMTQAEWISKIHEVLFEWRLGFFVELEKMNANIAVLNPHQAVIFWKSKLYWNAEVTSWDLRAWAAMVIAWLISAWETKVTNVEYIHRWYENLVENLKSLWADIQEI